MKKIDHLVRDILDKFSGVGDDVFFNKDKGER